jgi:hypothetical protein
MGKYARCYRGGRSAGEAAAKGFFPVTWFPLKLASRCTEGVSLRSINIYIIPLATCERNGRKYNHITVVVCRFTKMRHFIPIKGLTAAELADAFIKRVYSLYDAPETIISDRGTQFIFEF